MPLPGVHLALVALTTAALWFRRRYPVHVLVWTLLAAAISSALISNTGGHEWAAAMAVYAVASLRPTRTAWIAAGVTVLILAGIAWVTLDYYVAAVEIEAAPDQGGSPATPLQAFVALTSWMTVITLVALAIGTN